MNETIIFAVLFSMVMTIIEIVRRYPMTPGALIWTVDEPIRVIEKSTFLGKDHYVSTAPKFIRLGYDLFRLSHLDNSWGRLEVTWISDNYDAKTWHKHRMPRRCKDCDLEIARDLRMEEERNKRRVGMLATIKHADELGIETWGSTGYDSEAYYSKLREDGEKGIEDLPYASEEEENE